MAAGDGFCGRPVRRSARHSVVLVEIWPTAFRPAYAGGVRDEEQVRWAVRCCLQQQGAREGLRTWFNPASVSALAPAGVASVVDEEGWILGVC